MYRDSRAYNRICKKMTAPSPDRDDAEKESIDGGEDIGVSYRLQYRRHFLPRHSRLTHEPQDPSSDFRTSMSEPSTNSPPHSVARAQNGQRAAMSGGLESGHRPYERRWQMGRDASRGRPMHLTSWSEVEAHIHHRGKWDGYQRMLVEFGLDPDQLLPPAARRETPRLLYAEQPGCWLYPQDLERSYLLDELLTTGLFTDDSGRMALKNDSYRHWGAKHIFVLFAPHRALGETTLLPARFHRRHRNTSYGGLGIHGPVLEHIRQTFELLEDLLAAAAHDPLDFVKRVRDALARDLPAMSRRLLPGNASNAELATLGGRLARLDLEAARRPLAAGRAACATETSWCDLWQRVNGTFFGRPVGDISPLLNRYLLAITDPSRMAEKLFSLPGQAQDDFLALAGLVDDDSQFWIVGWERGSGSLVRTLGERREAITWQELRELAAEGRTGGPTAVVEYLAIAANGIYLVGDPFDGESAFERRVSQLCLDATGCSFPRISMPEPFADEPSYYLDTFDPDLRARASERLERFFAAPSGFEACAMFTGRERSPGANRPWASPL